MSLDPLYVLLGELSVRVFCPFSNWVVCLSGVECYEFFLYFGPQTLFQVIICKYIFPYSRFPFHFADVFFSHAETFYFDELPFVYSFLYIPCSRGHVKNIAAWNIWDFLRMLSSRILWYHNIYLSLLFILRFWVHEWCKLVVKSVIEY